MRVSETDPIRLDPEAIYDTHALRLLLGLSSAALARGRREGTLRYARRGRQTYYIGAWVLAWLSSAPEQEGSGR